jgi:hypothetical protein
MQQNSACAACCCFLSSLLSNLLLLVGERMIAWCLHHVVGFFVLVKFALLRLSLPPHSLHHTSAYCCEYSPLFPPISITISCFRLPR